MDLDALRNIDFGLLDDAVDDWSTMVDDLETLMDAAEKGLHGAANKANWAGYNATVSKEFIGKTAGEFTDAHSQASSIHKILRDTRDELKSYKGQLNDAIERGRQKNLTVIGYEGGFTVTSSVPPEGRAQQDKDNQGEITALRDEIQKILEKATESDTSASTVLMAIADQSKLGFSDVDYADRDSAAEAIKEADELTELAKKNPEDLTPKEFDRLNTILKKNADDELFAARFATRLGAEGTLDFWTGINDPHSAWKLGQQRADQYDDLQKNLSLALATASQSDSAGMTEWKSSMVDLVDKPVGRNGGFPLGGQVMSNLMRWGDYDDRFLVDYGDKLIETEKQFTGNGRHGAWAGTGADPLLNRTGTDSGWDPMTGYLKALSNSPDAATKFFNGTFVTKDEDHDFTHDTDGDGKQGRRTLSNFDYLFEERDWPQDRDAKGEDSIAGRNYLAAALEAATTGHPAGETPTVDTPPHNAAQTKLMESLVASIGDDPERLTKYGYMSDSIGQIASEYLPDMNRAVASSRFAAIFMPCTSAAEGPGRAVQRECFRRVEAGGQHQRYRSP
ncbi:WXG100 family type VII secretion target OS=Streptomyces aurantiogriseus OX=66870 GN=GCM10010251_33430 PE=4 SV=1 [Streptomyces aurantiogriseus]